MSGLHFGVRFWTPKRGPFCRQNFSHRAKNSKRFDGFCTYATEVFHAAAFPWFCSAAGTCSRRPANIYGHTCSCSRTGVGINVRRTWRTIAGGAAKPWEPSGPRYAKLLSRTCGNNRNLHYFSPDGRNFADKRHPFWGPETDPKTGAKSSGHKQIKLRLNEWPPFWGPFLDPKTGAVLSAKF